MFIVRLNEKLPESSQCTVTIHPFCPLWSFVWKRIWSWSQYSMPIAIFIQCQASLYSKFQRICQLELKLYHGNNSVYRRTTGTIAPCNIIPLQNIIFFCHIKILSNHTRSNTVVLFCQCSEWMLVFLNAKRAFCFSYIMARTRYILSGISWREQGIFRWLNDNILFVLDEHAYLNLYSAGTPKTEVCGLICHSIPTHYSDFEPISLCSYSLLMHS